MGPSTVGPMQVDSGGVMLDVEVHGDGTPGRSPVLLIHGFPDTKRLWTKQVGPLVDAGHQVITYDQRGTERATSRPTSTPTRSSSWRWTPIAVLDHLDVAKAHVVGHDWGAAAAWATASFSPDRVDRLVALSVGHPTAFATAGFAQREKSWYMLLFQFAPVAEEWLTADDGANFRAWSCHPDFDAVYAEVMANGSLTPAAELLPGQRQPGHGRRAATRDTADPVTHDGRPRHGRLRPDRAADGRVGRLLRGRVP